VSPFAQRETYVVWCGGVRLFGRRGGFRPWWGARLFVVVSGGGCLFGLGADHISTHSSLYFWAACGVVLL
jgi:hypothetical protein